MLAPWHFFIHVDMRTAIPCRNEGGKNRDETTDRQTEDKQTNKQTNKQANKQQAWHPLQTSPCMVLESKIQERSMNSTASYHLLLLLLLIHRVGT